MTIGEAVRMITAGMRVRPRPRTVDVLKVGREGERLKGIAVSFMPTHAVITRAAARGANLLVVHEPLWYNHLDETDWLAGDPVAAAKRRLLARHGMAVYRAHDTWHDRQPDGVLEGMARALGWERYQLPRGSVLFTFPRWTVARIAASAKRTLGIPSVRVVGDPALRPRKVAFLVGAWGGRRHIATLRRRGVEALVCGEAPEWETYEYVRDAAAQGRRTALIVLGHAASEEAGMRHLAAKLETWLPGVPVSFIPAGLPFRNR